MTEQKTGKTEYSQTKKGKKKSRRRRLFYWLVIDLAVAAIVIGLLLYKPSRYRPVEAPAGDPNRQVVHPYLYHDLAAQFYNDAQTQQPFTTTVLDALLNDAITSIRWPQESAGVTFSKPEVLFVPGRMVLMGTTTIEGAGFVLTIELAPEFDGEGLFNIRLRKVSVGAINITPLARMVGRRMYLQRLEELPSRPASAADALRMNIAGSLLDNQLFDPIFEVDGKWVRLADVNITEGRLTADFVPASKPVASH